MKKLILSLVVIVTLSFGATLEDARIAYNKKDFATAIKIYELLANQGNMEAQYELALVYYAGEGIERDLQKADKWSRKSAEQGNLDAFTLTVIIFHENSQKNSQDKEVTKKFEQAEKLAKKGKATDQYNLGQLYYKDKNIKEALYWFEQAANQGYAKAQYNLGVIYDKQKDTQKAFYWTEKAANQGLSVAQFNLGLTYLDTKNKSENPEKAFYWMEKAANQGDLDAMNYLGLMYKKGYGVNQNYTKASEWYKKACQKGNSNGCENYKKLLN